MTFEDPQKFFLKCNTENYVITWLLNNPYYIITGVKRGCPSCVTK